MSQQFTLTLELLLLGEPHYGVSATTEWEISEDGSYAVLNTWNGKPIDTKLDRDPPQSLGVVNYRYTGPQLHSTSDGIFVHSAKLRLTGDEFSTRSARVQLGSILPNISTWETLNWAPRPDLEEVVQSANSPFQPFSVTVKNITDTSKPSVTVEGFVAENLLPIGYAVVTKWNGESVGKHGYRLPLLHLKLVGAQWYFSRLSAVFPGEQLALFDATLIRTVTLEPKYTAKFRFGPPGTEEAYTYESEDWVNHDE